MEITKELTSKINEVLDAKGLYAETTSINKNNEVREGYVIKSCEEVEGISPVIYVGECEDEEEVFKMVEHVISTDKPVIKVEVLGSKEYILNHVFAEVVSVDSNLVTDEMVSRKFLNLAVLYRVEVEGVEDGSASFLVTKKVAEHAGVAEEELFEVVSKRDDYTIKSLYATLNELMEVPFFEEEEEDNMMPYVVTSPEKAFGANVLCTKFLEKVREKLGSDFYILPCSIHEIIVVNKENGMDLDALKDMVMTVNATELQPEDILSDSVYFYDANGLSLSA